MIRKVYNLQKVNLTKGDWYEMIQKEKNRYEILLTDEEISKMSRFKFKSLIEKNVRIAAFKYL